MTIKNFKDFGPTSPDKLQGSALLAWKRGAWVTCCVTPQRSAEIVAQYPPDQEWGRPGILACDMRTLINEIAASEPEAFQPSR